MSYSDKNSKNKYFNTADLELWKGLDAAVSRRDLFWIFYYVHELSTARLLREAKQHLPVIPY